MNTGQVFGAPFPIPDWREEEANPEDVRRIKLALAKRRMHKSGKSLAKVDFQGLGIELDRPKGFVQEGTGPDGTAWRRVYQYDYGFIPGTLGGDGEDIDVFVGNEPDASEAYWVTQAHEDGTFDEYKVFVGFPSPAHAQLAYALHIPPKLGVRMHTMTIEQMKAMLGQEPAEVLKAAFHAPDSSATVKAMRDYRTITKADISFEDLRRVIGQAIDAAYPVAAGASDGCSPCGTWVSDTYETYAVFDRDGFTYSVGYSYANGVVTLTGEPVQVVRQYVPVAGSPAGAPADQTKRSSAMPKMRKDDQPGAGAPGMGDPGDGSGGADIVSLAAERLDQINDAIEAGGGVLTADLKVGLSAVVALLETVAPDEDDEDDTEPLAEGVAATPDEVTAAKAATKQAREIVKRRFAKAQKFVAACAALFKQAKAEKDVKKRALLVGRLTKAIQYGQEVFGSETGFAGGENITITEFHDPAQLLPEETTMPVPQDPKGAFTQDALGYTSNTTSQTAADVGTPQSLEKRLSAVTASLKGLPVGKANGAPPDGTTELTKAWTESYLRALPDSSFLYVEAGAKKGADGQDLTGVGASLRHFAVRDAEGALSIPAIQKALQDITAAGFPDDVKKGIRDQAEALLKQAQGEATSNVQKSLRGDNGWPEDMAEPAFLAGSKKKKDMPFGFDNIVEKAKALPAE